jgi:serine O-acetyltransferase
VSALREPRAEGDGDLDLAAIAGELRRLRSAAQKRRYRSAPPPLPSREIIVDIVESLVAGLYPRHFGPADLEDRDVDAFIVRTLEGALHALQRQIELELALAREWKGDSRIDSPRRAPDIVKDFAAALPSVRALLDTDVRAAFEGDPSAKSIDEIIFCFPGFAAIIRHRVAHALYDLGVTMIARIVAEVAHSQTGIDIHPGARIGEGFFIDHGTGVVIGETTIIGRNVRLYQAVTLGAKRFEVDASGALIKNGAAPSDRRGRRRHLCRRDHPRPGHDRQGLLDRRQCLADPQRAARQHDHTGQGAERIVRRRRGDLMMARRTALQSLWRATRDGLPNLNRRLAESGDSSDMVFHAPPPIRSLDWDIERRFVEARKSQDPKRPIADKPTNSGRPSA